MTTTTQTTPIDYAQFDSAIGLNWYETDPNLRALMDRHVAPADRPWAEELLQHWGALCGGPIARRDVPAHQRPQVGVDLVPVQPDRRIELRVIDRFRLRHGHGAVSFRFVVPTGTLSYNIRRLA